MSKRSSQRRKSRKKDVPVRDLIASAVEIISRPLPADPLGRRNPEAVEIATELLGRLLDLWFSPEIEGFENVPAEPVLVVGTHNGGNMAPDMFTLMVAFWRRFGPDYPSYGLAHDQVIAMPGIGRMISLLGGVAAGQKNASALLDRGASVLVYPGGDVDTFKPYHERHTVKFGGRTGFIRLALRHQVPIVPVVSIGAHETFFVLTDGHRLASLLGLKRMFRLEVLPFILSLPWGLWVGPIEFHIPVPSKLHLRILPPVRFNLPPEAAEDRPTVESLAEEVRARMQTALDDLAGASGKKHGPRARLAEILQGR